MAGKVIEFLKFDLFLRFTTGTGKNLIAYKFNNLTQEELREMFGLDEFKKSRLYQDIYQEGEKEGKLQTVDALFRRGFSVEDIADIVQLDIDTVRLRVQKVQDN